MRKTGKQKKRRGFRRFMGKVFLLTGLLMAGYAMIVWIQVYSLRRTQVDFTKLRGQAVSADSKSSASKGFEEALQELIEKNAETLDFVENYPDREKYLGQDIDLQEDYTEGEVPLLMQWDKRWGYDLYGGNLMALSGCGPTCLSMAYLYFTGDLEGNPREIAKYCEEGGFHTKEGTSWDLWTEGVKSFGLAGEELPLDQKRMESTLDNGSLIVCSMRPGDFTETGHYILLYDYDENGFYIKDPNRRSNSERQWEYEVLKGQIKNLWGICEGE